MDVRKGSQTPSHSVILPYTSSEGDEACRIYEMTGIRVNKVSILVEAAAEGKASLPPPIVQLPPAQTESGDKL